MTLTSEKEQSFYWKYKAIYCQDLFCFSAIHSIYTLPKHEIKQLTVSLSID